MTIQQTQKMDDQEMDANRCHLGGEEEAHEVEENCHERRRVGLGTEDEI